MSEQGIGRYDDDESDTADDITLTKAEHDERRLRLAGINAIKDDEERMLAAQEYHRELAEREG